MEVNNNPVNWFEIPVDDLDRAKHFYEAVLGLELFPGELGRLKMAMFPMAEGVSGAAGTLVKGEGYVPSHQGSMVYFGVADIDQVLGRVQANGGHTITPKTSIGEWGFIAHFEDSEGNRIALHSMH